MGRWHADSLRRIRVPIAAVVDPDIRAAERLAGRVGRPCAAHASLTEALRLERAGAVHVCTPAPTHPGLIREALEAGLHVLAEKPLAADLPTTRELLRVARDAGRLLCPVHQFLFQAGVLEGVAELTPPEAILHVDMEAVSAGAAGSGPARAEEVMRDILPHPLSLFRRLMGSAFAGVSWQVASTGPGELRAFGTCGAASLGMLISMSGRPTRNTLRIVSTGGTFHVDLFHGFVTREGPAVSRGRKISRPFGVAGATALAAGVNLVKRGARREVAYPGLRELCRRFHRAVAGREPPPIDDEETLDVAAARDGILAVREAVSAAGP